MKDTSTTHENQIYATGKFAIPSIAERIGRVSQIMCYVESQSHYNQTSVTGVSGIIPA